MKTMKAVKTMKAMKAAAAMKAMKATKESAAVETSEGLHSPCHETRLRGSVQGSSYLTERPQTSGHSHEHDNEVSDCTCCSESETGTSSLGFEVPEFPTCSNLLRGGGKNKPKPKPKKQKQKMQTAANQNKQNAEGVPPANPPNKPPTPAPAPRPGPIKAMGMPALSEELCANHWSVPVCKEQELEHGKDGVALVSKAAYIAKHPVLAGTNSATAMLVNPHVETHKQADGSDWPVITVWVQKNGQILQQTKRLVQCGTCKVACNPPTAKGQAPKTQAMCTVVLEVVRSAFASESDWQRAATNATCAMQQYLSEHVAQTEWSDHKLKKSIPITRDGKTTAIAAYVRLPTELAQPLIKHSGTQASMVFARYYTSKECMDKTPKLINLWLKVETLQQAKQKYMALPQSKVQGLAWSPKGFAVRVLEEHASEIAPLATDMPYTAGEKYEIAGVPRDWTPAELFASLAATDTPWPEIERARLLFRKGRGAHQRWIIKAPCPPTAIIVFLDEFALAIQKAEDPTPQVQARNSHIPAPTAGTWAQALATGHMEVEAPSEVSVEEGNAGKDNQSSQAPFTAGAQTQPAPKHAPKANPPQAQVAPARQEAQRSRSPVHRPGQQPPTTAPQGDNELLLRQEVDGLKAQMAQMMAMMQSMQNTLLSSQCPPHQQA